MNALIIVIMTPTSIRPLQHVGCINVSGAVGVLYVEKEKHIVLNNQFHKRRGASSWASVKRLICYRNAVTITSEEIKQLEKKGFREVSK